MGKTATEMKYEIEQKRDDLTYDIEAIEDRIRPSRVARRRADVVRSKMHRAREAVMGRVEDTAGSARDLVDSAGDAPQQLTSVTQGNPIAAGMVAFGLGMLTAAILPETSTEHELAESVRPQLDRAKETLTSTLRDDAQQVADNLRPQVEDSLDELQSTAKRAAERVQESASPGSPATPSSRSLGS